MTDSNYAYHDEDLIMCITDESPSYSSVTNTILYISYVPIKNDKKIKSTK